MRILVIEDKAIHQQSARETLAGHDVNVVESFDDAMDLMGKSLDPVVPLPYEAVLTDMMMPMSKWTLLPECFNPGEQVPYGFVIALRAALLGVKFVAMVTDMNHHKSAMSAALDHLGPTYYEWPRDDKYKVGPKVFSINGAKVVFVHTPFVKDITKDVDCSSCKGSGTCRDCDGTLKYRNGSPCWCTHRDFSGKCYNCKGTLKYDREVEVRKDWGRVLADLAA